MQTVTTELRQCLVSNKTGLFHYLNIKQTNEQLERSYNLTFEQTVTGLRLFKSLGSVRIVMFLQEVSYPHQGCIYLIQKYSKNSNIVKYY